MTDPMYHLLFSPFPCDAVPGSLYPCLSDLATAICFLAESFCVSACRSSRAILTAPSFKPLGIRSAGVAFSRSHNAQPLAAVGLCQFSCRPECLSPGSEL